MKLLSQEEIEKHYDKCDFDDDCDFCETPELAIFANLC